MKDHLSKNLTDEMLDKEQERDVMFSEKNSDAMVPKYFFEYLLEKNGLKENRREMEMHLNNTQKDQRRETELGMVFIDHLKYQEI